MTDIGDDVTIPIVVHVAGTLTDAATVTVSVTAPSGAVSTPTATRLSLGTYEAVVTVDEAQRWRYTVTTTDPDSKTHDHFDVAANPPARLEPLATIADLEDRLQITGVAMTDGQRAAAPAFLRDASARIRRHTKKTFDKTLADEMVLRPIGSELRLPRTPVIAVTQVEQIGAAGTTDRVMSVGEWAFDGIDKIELWPDPHRYQSVPVGTGYYTDTYRPRWDHGYLTTPDDVVAVCCNMVLAVLTSPTFTANLRSETIGSYSYSLGGDGAAGLRVRLSDEDKEDLKHYRRRAGTVGVKAG